MTETFNGSKAFLMIPPSVAHDRALLKKPKSIILLGEIVSMLNVTGEFYMSNATLAEKLDCSKKSISNYLSLLEKLHLIRRAVLKKNSGEIDSRKITAGDALKIAFSSGWSDSKDIARCDETEFHTPGTKLPYPPEPDCHTLGKHVATKENIYKKNSMNINIYSSADTEPQYKQEFEKLWEKYPKGKKQGKQLALKSYTRWRKSHKDNTFDKAKMQLKKYLNYVKVQHVQTQYIKAAKTWFANIDDEYDQSAKPVQNNYSQYNKRVEKGTDWSKKKPKVDKSVNADKLTDFFKDFENKNGLS